MTDHLLIAGQRHPLKRDAYLIGRGPESDLLLPEDDASASRAHARLERASGGGWIVVDLGSSNGTFVNDKPVSGSQRLAHGDAVRVGRTVIRLDAPPAPTEPKPMPVASTTPRERVDPPQLTSDSIRAASQVSDKSLSDPAAEVPAFLRTTPRAATAPVEKLSEPPLSTVGSAPTSEKGLSSLEGVVPAPPVAEPLRPADWNYGEPKVPENDWSANAGVDRRSTPMAYLDLAPAGFMALSWLLPWFQVNLFGYGLGGNYLDVLGHLGAILELGQRDARVLAVLIPLVTVVLTSMARVPALGGILMIVGGGIGTLASAALLQWASSGMGGVSLTSVLGIGFFLYAATNFAAIGLGVARLLRRT